MLEALSVIEGSVVLKNVVKRETEDTEVVVVVFLLAKGEIRVRRVVVSLTFFFCSSLYFMRL